MLTWSELLDIELRNRGNEDVERLIAYARWANNLPADVRRAMQNRLDYRQLRSEAPVDALL